MSMFPSKNTFWNQKKLLRGKNANQTILESQKLLLKKLGGTLCNFNQICENLIKFANKVSTKKGDVKEMWRILRLNDSEYEILRTWIDLVQLLHTVLAH